MKSPIDQAFDKVFGKQVDQTKDTHRGTHWEWPSLDPGQWSPRSLLIIYHEGGLPDDGTHRQMGPLWAHLEKELTEIFAVRVFRENINGAVSALYRY